MGVAGAALYNRDLTLHHKCVTQLAVRTTAVSGIGPGVAFGHSSRTARHRSPARSHTVLHKVRS